MNPRRKQARRPATSRGERVKFVNPPINELVVSLFHLPILELKAQHVGIYWERIRQRFQFCEQQPVVTAGSTDIQPLADAPGEIFPIPRFWFHSDKHPTLIQIQRNAFMLNWRRVSDAQDYPHFEAVVDDFWRELGTYTTFIGDIVGGKLDVVQKCELTYINLVEQSEFFASPSDVKAVLPVLSSLTGLATKDRELSGMNGVITHRVNPSLFVDLSTRVGRQRETGQLVLVFELKAHGSPADLSLDGARTWYEAAHDATYKMFLDATSKHMQEETWKPRR